MKHLAHRAASAALVKAAPLTGVEYFAEVVMSRAMREYNNLADFAQTRLAHDNLHREMLAEVRRWYPAESRSREDPGHRKWVARVCRLPVHLRRREIYIHRAGLMHEDFPQGTQLRVRNRAWKRCSSFPTTFHT